MQHRPIKSFVLRAGRISPRQQQGLDLWLSDYDMPRSGSTWCLNEIFGRSADTIVEIGFGMGASLCTQASLQPQVNFIGVEVHRAGIGSLAADLHDHGLSNVRIAPFDAVEVFQQYIIDGSLAGVQIFFPDPWPKLRHHKRRLVQSDFIRMLTQKLKIGGFIHCATDWHDYAIHMQEVLSAEETLMNQGNTDGIVPRPDTRPITKFEQRGTRLGHGVWDLMFYRV